MSHYLACHSQSKSKTILISDLCFGTYFLRSENCAASMKKTKIKTEIRHLTKKLFKVIFLVLKSTRICLTKIKNRTSYPSVVIIEVVTFFFNSPTTPLMFVQENQQLYHYFFLPSLTWRTPFLTVPAVHLNFTTTFGLCCEDCYEEKSDQLKLALNI